MPLATLLLALLPQNPAPPAAPATPPAPPVPHFAKPRLVASGWPDEAAIAVIADCDGDGAGDLLAVHIAAPGNAEFARNVRKTKFGTGALGIRLPDGGSLAGLAAIRAHREKDKPERITFHFADGAAWQLGKDDQGWRFAAAGPGEAYGGIPLWRKDGPPVGDFDGDGHEEPLGDAPFLRDLPPGARITIGDFQGDRRDDVLIRRFDGGWRNGRDVLVVLSYLDGDADQDGDGLDNAREAALKSDPLDADTDHDGLLDGQEVNGDGGIDLAALGCSPTHQDVLVYVQRYDSVDGARAKAEIERAAAYWATLPGKNPDGTGGIHLVPMWLGPLPAAKIGPPWWDLGEANLPVAARGIAHYMIVSPGGGGQSGELADQGGCGDHALYATFLHEFGHQVGLTHSGGPGAGWAPVYTSMMNYSYSYGFEDDYNKIHYSTGELLGLQLDEHKLSERVALPIEKLQFLAKGPYRFHLQADGDGTFVDWNRNGKFDAGTVAASITDTYGVGAGQRFPQGKSLFAPCLATLGEQLLLFTVDKDSRLVWRRNLGEGKWTEPAVAAPVTPTGDPWVVAHGGQLHAFVPTADGAVELAAATPEQLAQATARPLADSKGAALSAVGFRDRLLVLLWTAPDAPIRVVERNADGAFGPARELPGIHSEMAVAAVEDPSTGELCVGGGNVDKEKDGEKRHWTLWRFAAEADGSFHLASTTRPGGDKSGWAGNRRPVLLCEGKDQPTPGRLHFLAPGWLAKDGNGCFYEAITIGDHNQDSGWRLRRFYDEWTTTRWPLGACFHNGDIALAFGWANTPGQDADGNVHVSHRGFGLCDGVLSDFDDVSEIRGVGLSHSLAWRRGSVQ